MTYLQRLLEVFFIATRLGFTSFGGPVAHLAYFHAEYVRKRKWLNEQSYAELVALCQFLPGPASSQVGIGIGVLRGGLLGGIISFLGFTFPSVIVLLLFASATKTFNLQEAAFIHGLKIVAVVVVAHAVIGMAEKLTPDLHRKAVALIALAVTLLWMTPVTQIVLMAIAGIYGALFFTSKITTEASSLKFPISRRFGTVCLSVFFGLLFGLPLLHQLTSLEVIAFFERFYRAGALVFGGGHVVLPLLEQSFVPTGAIDEATFLSGYGATQAVPGPLFTFAAYLGAVMNGWAGGLLATLAIFLPAFLLILGVLPFWTVLRKHPKIKGALLGVNAAVVGILIAALYNPIWTSTILQTRDFVFAAILFGLLVYWKWPAWVIVGLGIAGGMGLAWM
ncbi:chromate efflux transporter [Bacillus sp. FSL W7-1360]